MEMLGDLDELDEKLRQFDCSARLLGQSVELAEKYDQQWVAAYNGAVVAHAPTFQALLKSIDEKNIPREDTAVRRLQKVSGMRVR